MVCSLRRIFVDATNHDGDPAGRATKTSGQTARTNPHTPRRASHTEATTRVPVPSNNHRGRANHTHDHAMYDSQRYQHPSAEFLGHVKEHVGLGRAYRLLECRRHEGVVAQEPLGLGSHVRGVVAVLHIPMMYRHPKEVVQLLG